MLKNCIKLFKNNKYLLLVIVLASALRFWDLSSSPPALNWDEISHGYNAYSILKTGRDEWGNFLPVIFRAYGDYKLPLYIYLTVVSEFLFGLTPFAVRLVSVLAGIGTVLVSYFLVLELFNKEKEIKLIALLTSFLVAIEPWSLFVSRPAFEANLALFFFTLATFLFFKFINLQKTWFLVLAALFFGLTVWTYNSYRLFTPLMMFALIIIHRKEVFGVFDRSKKAVLASLIVLLFFLIPMFGQLLSNVGQARYSWVQIIDEGTVARIEEIRNAGGSRFVHNKFTYFAFEFSKNYVSHFSPEFIFSRGSDDYQFNVPGKGLLYPINMPFLYLGLVILFIKVLKSNGENTSGVGRWWIILVWVLLSPIPSSLTREAPHVLRDLAFLPVPMILTAFGVSETVKLFREKINGKFMYGLYFLLTLVFLSSYLKTYFNDYRVKYLQAWQYGYDQVADYIKSSYSRYDKIIVTKRYGEPHEFLLFYLKWDPNKYYNNPKLNRFNKSNWYWVDSFDKFYFVNDWEVSEHSSYTFPRSLSDKDIFKLENGEKVDCHGTGGKCLLITSPGNFPAEWKKLKTIGFLDGSPAFEIYEN